MERSGRSNGVGGTSASLRRLVADPAHGLLPALLLVLTVLAGVVDAVSILSLARVFVANMTGNVVFIGFALAGAAGFLLAASLSALGSGISPEPPLGTRETKGPHSRAFLSSGGGIRTRDLRVMSPTSYLAAPPRGESVNLAMDWLRG